MMGMQITVPKQVVYVLTTEIIKIWKAFSVILANVWGQGQKRNLADLHW